MSLRPQNCPIQFGGVPGGTSVPANINQSSQAIWSDDILLYSFQLVATGTAAGTIQIQASDDKAVGVPANQYQPTNWNNIGTAVAVSGAGSYLVPPPYEISYEYLRLVYTDTSGGTATGNISARMKSMAL
jgi:hypothetical protein